MKREGIILLKKGKRESQREKQLSSESEDG
jgi:hypothetical protein